MHEFRSERAAELVWLAATIRSDLEQAKVTIASLNDQLNELAIPWLTS